MIAGTVLAIHRESEGVMKVILLATVPVLFAGPAFADDWSVAPWTGHFDTVTVTVGGEARGALFVPDAPPDAAAVGTFRQHWASGAADLVVNLQRDFDSGMVVALKTSFEVLRDRLSYDNYGGHLVQKVYGQVETGLGKLTIGMADGAAYRESVTGPVVDAAVSLDNPNTLFFIDPSTGRPFQEVFGLSTAVNSSSNYAKIGYYSPRLFGIEIGVSYTPSQGREVIPFLNNGPHAANRQKSIWETAVSYSQSFEDFSIGFYGAAAFGHGDGKMPSDAGLTDWGLGLELGIPLGEESRFAVGGAYRRANITGFDIYEAHTTGDTESAHLSATYTWRDWSVGAEYGRGTADGEVGTPQIGVKAYEIALGYKINTNLQASFGWQQQRYDRDLGSFYDGSHRIQMDAVFLHLRFYVSDGTF
jgi:predicted porin